MNFEEVVSAVKKRSAIANIAWTTCLDGGRRSDGTEWKSERTVAWPFDPCRNFSSDHRLPEDLIDARVSFYDSMGRLIGWETVSLNSSRRIFSEICQEETES